MRSLCSQTALIPILMDKESQQQFSDFYNLKTGRYYIDSITDYRDKESNIDYIIFSVLDS